MANSLTPQDVYALMNSIVEQATGQKTLTVTDTSSFVSVGETLLRTSAENTLNAISTVLARTIFSVRPYKGKFESLRVSAERWGAMVRKVVYLYSEAEQSSDWNTNLDVDALADGNSVDMFTINAPKAIQLNFYGTKVLQKSITRFRDQLSLAFSNEDEFVQFINGVMTEFYNEIEMLNENESRLTALNFMAGLSAMDLGVVDLVAEYNTEYGTTYTREQLLTEYLESFMKFVSATIKIYSDRLTDNTSIYHANLVGKAPILRHSPKDVQKMLMYAPFFTSAKANVYSGLFNPKYLEIGEFEGVNFWQSSDEPTKISITPNILDVTTGESKTSTNVSLDYVLGLLYDRDAMGVQPQFDYASTTPFNSKGGYYNMFYHWRFNSYNDFTENAVLFILGAGGAGEAGKAGERSKVKETK